METNADRAALFWKKVILHKADQCWRWNAATDRDGYGVFWLGYRKGTGAHRFSYMLENGPIPDGLLVRHKCDNPGCVNPRHLVTGTVRDNSRDSIERGRTPTGERNGGAKLTAARALQIRDSDGPLTKVAREYGISRSAVWKIRNGLKWRCLQEQSPCTPA